MSKDLETEEQILEAAQQVFQQKGFAGARMQEIADEAGINKSMLHYYFRSKDKLFQKVFQQAMHHFFPKVFQVLRSELALVPKIQKLVETYYDMFREQPHLPSFIIHEMNQHPERFKQFVKKVEIEMPKSFVKQIQEEIKAGTMRAIDPREFILNTIALCVFPVIARPMVEMVFNMDEEQYLQFIKRRKKELPKFILNAVRK
ncbi:MAG TPA: TetR/AcrR family transcriptional regulator [Balneolaceae bacterium]|nr:TetR/AcrR family transcriptional regulator [Balneolaceae bacterium]